MKDWWVVYDVVAASSAEKEAESKHGCRSTRLHKWSFEALVLFIIIKILETLTLDDAFTSLIGKFSGGSSPARVSNSLSLFFNIRNSITAASGTLSSIFVNYFKSVSALLEMIISIKECYIEMHLEAKRDLVPQLFAFGR